MHTKNEKQYLENGMSSKGRQKVKHYNQYYLSQKKLLTADLMLTKGHCWMRLILESLTSEEVNILPSIGPLMSLSEPFSLIFLPIL